MRLNEHTAISTSRVLLVPYDRRHVARYHVWMADPAIQEATASEPLTLEEEYENQASWRASRDKLTFIVCRPLSQSLLGGGDAGATEGVAAGQEGGEAAAVVHAGVAHAEDRMVGDVNFFLYPSHEEEEGEEEEEEEEEAGVVGEVDIMIAAATDRGNGLGAAAVRALLHYVRRHAGGILREYYHSHGGEETVNGLEPKPEPKLKKFMAKIKADNGASIALFRSLGFRQEGGVNYFGEVKLVLDGPSGDGGEDGDGRSSGVPEGYAELVYQRPDGEEL